MDMETKYENEFEIKFVKNSLQLVPWVNACSNMVNIFTELLPANYPLIVYVFL